MGLLGLGVRFYLMILYPDVLYLGFRQVQAVIWHSGRQKNQEFKGILGYIVSSRLACVI